MPTNTIGTLVFLELFIRNPIKCIVYSPIYIATTILISGYNAYETYTQKNNQNTWKEEYNKFKNALKNENYEEMKKIIENIDFNKKHLGFSTGFFIATSALSEALNEKNLKSFMLILTNSPYKSNEDFNEVLTDVIDRAVIDNNLKFIKEIFESTELKDLMNKKTFSLTIDSERLESFLKDIKITYPNKNYTDVIQYIKEITKSNTKHDIDLSTFKPDIPQKEETTKKKYQTKF